LEGFLIIARFSANRSAPVLFVVFEVLLGLLVLCCAMWIWSSFKVYSLDKRIRRLEKLKEEIEHCLGPSGEVLRPSEYYSASTQRIEAILDEIRQTVSQD
jgi:hypothetical protein